MAFMEDIEVDFCVLLGMWWHRWLTHCTTNQKVMGSISDEVIRFFMNLILPVALWPWG